MQWYMMGGLGWHEYCFSLVSSLTIKNKYERFFTDLETMKMLAIALWPCNPQASSVPCTDPTNLNFLMVIKIRFIKYRIGKVKNIAVSEA